jgi:hypothetical protein
MPIGDIKWKILPYIEFFSSIGDLAFLLKVYSYCNFSEIKNGITHIFNRMHPDHHPNTFIAIFLLAQKHLQLS